MADTTTPTPRPRFSAQPVETTFKTSRRFPVAPVETSTRSNKKEGKKEDDSQDANGNGTKDGHVDQSIAAAGIDARDMAVPKRRFLPEPVETSSYKSSKSRGLPIRKPATTTSPPPPEENKTKRRFTPQLIETCKRSKKAGDTRPATLPTDKVCSDCWLECLLQCPVADWPDRYHTRNQPYLR